MQCLLPKTKDGTMKNINSPTKIKDTLKQVITIQEEIANFILNLSGIRKKVASAFLTQLHNFLVYYGWGSKVFIYN